MNQNQNRQINDPAEFNYRHPIDSIDPEAEPINLRRFEEVEPTRKILIGTHHDRYQAGDGGRCGLPNLEGGLRETGEEIDVTGENRSATEFEKIIGQSNSLQLAFHQMRQVAPTDSTVLILGETGTGKELLAHAIHTLSSRKQRPMVKVNCAALPASLIESELFGHEKGAFTGAQIKRVGRFEAAHGATLFLDEVGELPLDLQAKLLRVLQEGEFERLGSNRSIKVEVRMIAATNQNLEEAVLEGRFRADLYYRLNVFPLRIPPLRERREDIPLLVGYFVRQQNQRLGKRIEVVPREVLKTLQQYHWPGNIRELKNVIERATIVTQGRELQLREELMAQPESRPIEAPPEPPSPPEPLPRGVALEEVEKEHILRVLKQTYWRIEGKFGAAAILGLNPGTLRSRMKKLRIQRPMIQSEWQGRFG
ncbi:MAG TPA: sigma 54-interacting transcriptional regulator [Blastocatellia bacterium]|nr:sigma 54-interacting transcriptional regulator [Blastocatellia bacterium]